eukprot:jgi/Chlat1/7594/Chrsp64S07153
MQAAAKKLEEEAFTTQLSENDMVRKELALLEDGAAVYKLIGPVLIKQDLDEAKSNVGKRIDFIQAELQRLESQRKSSETKAEAKRTEILKLQQKAQPRQT